MIFRYQDPVSWLPWGEAADPITGQGPEPCVSREHDDADLNAEAGAPSELALKLDAAAHEPDVFSTQRKAEPGARFGSLVVRQTHEGEEDPLEILLRDAGPGVFELEALVAGHPCVVRRNQRVVELELSALAKQHALGVAYHGGKLYVADTYNSKIKVLDPATRECKTFLGGEPEGWLATPLFSEPAGICYADGKLYVADTNAHRVRVVDLKTKTVSTLKLQGVEAPKLPGT